MLYLYLITLFACRFSRMNSTLSSDNTLCLFEATCTYKSSERFRSITAQSVVDFDQRVAHYPEYVAQFFRIPLPNLF